MRKILSVAAIIISLILILLAYFLPQRNSKNVVSTSSIGRLSSTPVEFLNYNSNTRYIDSLSKFIYVAHRGAPLAAKEPENSLPAFKASKKLGFKIVETDLHLTKDGQWVVMHDHSLDRTTTGKGTVKSKSLKYIKKLKLKEAENELLLVPTMDEFLSLCSKEALIPILDIKPNEDEITSENYNDLLLTLHKYNLLDKSIFTSYSKEVLTELRKRDNITPIAVMMEPSEANIAFTKQLGNSFMYLNHSELSDATIDLIGKNNLRYGVWTINDEKVAKHFLDRGAIMIVTDSLLFQQDNINGYRN
ncbi:hypothetical protein NBE98_21520 [Clostridium swellfunianum]|uniref:glycerophosphodiester phosphodiesterase n=1 Tax=Clostridium swellfunianum TaxID=1367462 RepID=UPI00202E3FE1|nr:glycerophosphodiester phosphodiesterase family protein [Clostridium swellfunianum]MCM0650941.1 hypothetical protein [Clostridium swellfunianum]